MKTSLGISLVNGSSFTLLWRYILNDDLFHLYGMLCEVIMPLDVLHPLVELWILSESDGGSVVTQHLNMIINFRSKLEILKEILSHIAS